MTTLERRIAELEQLADSQGRELRIQFERIAQMQAEWDVLRIRLSGVDAGAETARRRLLAVGHPRFSEEVHGGLDPSNGLALAHYCPREAGEACCAHRWRP